MWQVNQRVPGSSPGGITIGPGGGTGRRAVLRGQCPYGRAGSIPVPGTSVFFCGLYSTSPPNMTVWGMPKMSSMLCHPVDIGKSLDRTQGTGQYLKPAQSKPESAMACTVCSCTEPVSGHAYDRQRWVCQIVSMPGEYNPLPGKHLQDDSLPSLRCLTNIPPAESPSSCKHFPAYLP